MDSPRDTTNSLSEWMESGIFDSTLEISTAIENVGSKFPIEIIKMLMGYDSQICLRDLMAKFNNRFRLSGNELNFYSHDFLKRLDFQINKNGELFDNIPFLWDLERLLFKSIIYLKQKIIGASSYEFEIVSNDIQKIFSFIDSRFKSNIHRKVPSTIYEFSLKSNDFSFIFLHPEFLEHYNYLAHSLVEILKYFYSPILTKEKRGKEEIEKITCKGFKNRFFTKGNLDSDILLKEFIIKYGLKEELIKDCFLSNIDPNYSKINEELIRIQVENAIKELESKDAENFIGIPDIRYMSISMNFYLKNGKRVLIKNEDELYYFLQRMNDEGLLYMEYIKRIAGFKNQVTGEIKWNPTRFKRYLTSYRNYCRNSDIEREFCNECLKLFNLSLVKRFPSRKKGEMID